MEGVAIFKGDLGAGAFRDFFHKIGIRDAAHCTEIEVACGDQDSLHFDGKDFSKWVFINTRVQDGAYTRGKKQPIRQNKKAQKQARRKNRA